jgi:hypothetical protein
LDERFSIGPKPAISAFSPSAGYSKVPVLNILLLTYHGKVVRWVDSIEILEYREVAKIAENDGVFSISVYLKLKAWLRDLVTAITLTENFLLSDCWISSTLIPLRASVWRVRFQLRITR